MSREVNKRDVLSKERLKQGLIKEQVNTFFLFLLTLTWSVISMVMMLPMFPSSLSCSSLPPVS